jgi:cleavage and polyadenylation specificity factor subunit 2
MLQTFPLIRPKLVLAIPPSMSHGPSRWLFTVMASTEGNVILLTSRSEDNTLARDLYARWEAEQEVTARWGQGKVGRLLPLNDRKVVEVYYTS